MAKKNVLHLVEYLYLGGIERLLEQLALHSKERANVHFFTYETSRLEGIGKDIRDHGFPVFTYKKKEGRDWELFSELVRIIKENKIEVLHTHDFGPVEYAVLLKMRFPKLKLVHTQHTIIHFIRHRKYTLFFEIASYFYDRIIAVSESSKADILRHCPYMKKSILRVIPNGVDTKLFGPLPQSFDGNILRLVSISRISPEKNLNYLLNTCRLLKEKGIPFTFDHAGTGKTPEQLAGAKKYIRDHQLEGEVTLHGFTTDVLGILRKGEVFVSASHTEGHPVAVLEAMSSQKVCFCSDIGPHRELFPAVYLFDKSSEEALADALGDFHFHREKKNHQEIGEKARASVLEKFSIEKMVDQYVAQY